MINRRGLITGLISLAAAPAIVRASSLMPVKVIKPRIITFAEYNKLLTEFRLDILYGQMNLYGVSMMEIEHDPNTSDGIIFTPIRDILELD